MIKLGSAMTDLNAGRYPTGDHWLAAIRETQDVFTAGMDAEARKLWIKNNIKPIRRVWNDFEIKEAVLMLNALYEENDFCAQLRAEPGMFGGSHVPILHEAASLIERLEAGDQIDEDTIKDICRRLRGVYHIPITDGLGAAGGEEPDNPNTFVRSFDGFPRSPLQEAAANRIASFQKNA